MTRPELMLDHGKRAFPRMPTLGVRVFGRLRRHLLRVGLAQRLVLLAIDRSAFRLPLQAFRRQRTTGTVIGRRQVTAADARGASRTFLAGCLFVRQAFALRTPVTIVGRIVDEGPLVELLNRSLLLL